MKLLQFVLVFNGSIFVPTPENKSSPSQKSFSPSYLQHTLSTSLKDKQFELIIHREGKAVSQIRITQFALRHLPSPTELLWIEPVELAVL